MTYECFNGKVALVTGAGTGMGASTALMLAKFGASVAVVGIEEGPIEAVAGQIEALGARAIAIKADVAKLEDNERMIAETIKAFGSLHYAVNNAGISGAFGSIEDTSAEEWRHVIGVDLDGVFFGLKYELPAAMQAVIDRTPANRMGQPQEVANVITFLLSDQASFVVGAEVIVDGGLILQ